MAWLLPATALLAVGRFRPSATTAIAAPLAVVLVVIALRRPPSQWPGAVRLAAARLGSAPPDSAAPRSASPGSASSDSASSGSASLGRSQRPARAWTVWCGLAGTVAVAAGFGVWQLLLNSPQIIVLRDPGALFQYGYWIAGHGTLPIPRSVIAFGGPHPGLTFASTGFVARSVGLSPQFMPGLPVLLAAGWWIHGLPAATIVSPVLGALAVLSFGGLAGRLAGPQWAPVAALVLALSLPVQYTSRSAFSEPLTALLLSGGLALVVDALTVRPAVFRRPRYSARPGQSARPGEPAGSVAVSQPWPGQPDRGVPESSSWPGQPDQGVPAYPPWPDQPDRGIPASPPRRRLIDWPGFLDWLGLDQPQQTRGQAQQSRRLRWLGRGNDSRGTASQSTEPGGTEVRDTLSLRTAPEPTAAEPVVPEPASSDSAAMTEPGRSAAAEPGSADRGPFEPWSVAGSPAGAVGPGPAGDATSGNGHPEASGNGHPEARPVSDGPADAPSGPLTDPMSALPPGTGATGLAGPRAVPAGLGAAAMGGLALGLTMLVSLNSLPDLVAVIPFLGVLAAARRPQVIPLALGVIAGVGCGLAAAHKLAPSYLAAPGFSLHRLSLIAAGVAAATLVVAGLAAWRPVRRGLQRLLRARPLRWLPELAAIGVAAVLIGFAVRPYLQTAHWNPGPATTGYIAALQKLLGLPVQPTRSYAEDSLYWVTWYVGIPAVLLGGFGVALLVRRCGRALLAWTDEGGLARVWALPLLIIVPATFRVLWAPDTAPDQPWASRELVPVVLPGFILGAIWVSAWLAGRARNRGSGTVAVSVAAACFAVALAVPTAITTFGITVTRSGPRHVVTSSANGLALLRTGNGQVTALDRLCGAMSSNMSVILLDRVAADEFAQVIRSMCGVPAAVMAGEPSSKVRSAVFAIERQGRQPALLSTDAGELIAYGIAPRQVVGFSSTQDAHDLTQPPTTTWQISYNLWIAVPGE